MKANLKGLVGQAYLCGTMDRQPVASIEPEVDELAREARALVGTLKEIQGMIKGGANYDAFAELAILIETIPVSRVAVGMAINLC